MTMNGVVHLVLNLPEEQTCSRRISVVVYGSSINIGQLLIEPPFTETNLPDFGQQMLEIVISDKRTVFHPLLVNHIPSYGKLTQNESTPLPELGCPCAVHPITH